jgi:hypothetical protein
MSASNSPLRIHGHDHMRFEGLTQFTSMLQVDRRKELNTNGIELDARMSPTYVIITAQPLASC